MVKAMYDFKEFYDVGEELAQTGDEAHIRSAINRDYYALFGESRKYLVEVRKKKYLTTKKGIHGKVCNTLLASSDPTEKYLGKMLFKLIPIRGQVDYDWKNYNFEDIKNAFPQIQNEVKKGLESLEYLNDKYDN